jgi:hypothetical protein
MRMFPPALILYNQQPHQENSPPETRLTFVQKGLLCHGITRSFRSAYRSVARCPVV